MKIYVHIAAIFALTLAAASALPNILIEGRTASGTWPNISDGDLNPNQDVTDFGTVDYNSFSDRRYRIRNNGNQTLTVFVNGNSPTSNSSQFTFPNFPSGNFTVAAGANREFLIRYRPVTSSRTGTIRIDSNTGSAGDTERIYTFTVQGKARGGEISVNYNPSSGSDVGISDGSSATVSRGTDFGSRRVGGGNVSDSFIERDFYVRNSSGASDPLTLSNPRLTGSGAAHFEIRSLGTSNLSPGNNRNFKIRFNPSSPGVKNANFIIDSNDPDENPYNFALTGTGTAFSEIRVQGRREQTGATFTELLDNDGSARSEDGTRFDNTNVGSTRDSIFRVHNDGDATLTLSGRSITGSGASAFSFIGFDSSIAPGASADFEVRFNPPAAGTFNATVSFTTNDSNENPFNFAIRGSGLAPEIVVEGRDRDNIFRDITDGGGNSPSGNNGTHFGNVNVTGSSAQLQFRIRNTGNDALNITARSFIGDTQNEYSVQGLLSLGNRKVEAGQSHTFSITFDPKVVGARPVIFSMTTDDPDEGTFTFDLTGVGIGRPEIRLQGRREQTGATLTELGDNDTSPRSNDGTLFNNTLVGSSRDSIFRIHNDGDAVLNLSNPTITGTGASAFSFIGFDSSIPARDSADFEVRFRPTANITYNATVTFNTNDSNENPFNFAIRGTGLAPEIVVEGRDTDNIFRSITDGGSNTPSLNTGTNFGNVNLTGSTAQREFRIRNTGNETLTISARSFIGDTQNEYSVQGLLSLGTRKINAGENHTFSLSFDPEVIGSRPVIFSMTTDDPDEGTFTFDLTGVGVGQPEIRVQGRREQTGATFTEIGDNDPSPRSQDGTLFNDEEVGATKDSIFRVHNDGDAVLNLSGATITGPGASAFSFIGFDSSIPADDSADFEVRFSPTANITYNAVVSFNTNDSSANPFNFAIRGTGIAPEIAVHGRGTFQQFGLIQDGDTTPNVTDGTNWNTTEVGSEETYQFRINNTGNDVLRITGRQFIGDTENEFSVSGLLSLGVRNIDPGESHLFNITFDPKNVGVELVTFELRSNDADEDPYTFRLRAEGIGEPEIQVRGLSSLSGLPFDIDDGDLNPDQDVTSFGNVNFNSPEFLSFRIVNDGTDDLVISSAISSNPLFEISGIESPIEPGDTDTFFVRFAPTELGEDIRTTITLNNNVDSSASAYTFALTANGVGAIMKVFGGDGLANEITEGTTVARDLTGTLFPGRLPSNGSVTSRFQIRNEGNRTLVMQFGSTVTGPGASSYDISSLRVGDPILGTVPPGGTQNFSVTFDPTTTGILDAVIDINSNTRGDRFTFAVSGLGIDPNATPDIQVRGGTGFARVINPGDTSPAVNDGTDFGTIPAGSGPVSKTFQIRNNDVQETLTVTGESLFQIGSSFATTTSQIQLAPGQRTSFTVTLDPAAGTGRRSAIISVSSNDPDVPSYSFNITGMVEAADPPEPSITEFSPDGDDLVLVLDGAGSGTFRIVTSTDLETWITVPGKTGLSSGSIRLEGIFNQGNMDPRRFFRAERE